MMALLLIGQTRLLARKQFSRARGAYTIDTIYAYTYLSHFVRSLKMSMAISSPGSPDLAFQPKKTRLACDSIISLQVKKLTANATTPSRGSPQAAGYDLYSAYDVAIPAEGKALVKTDIAIALPEGCYGRVAPRSSLSWKSHIDVGAGVIDRDYRGNVGVVLFNLSKVDYEVKRGDRIAQLVLERIFTPPVEEVEELSSTERGAGGFGSTGN